MALSLGSGVYTGEPRFVAALGDVTTVVVTGDGVCLRAGASLATEVVAQVDKGATLSAIPPFEGEWVRVVPPVEVDFWIFDQLLEQGVVSVATANIRAGAGRNFSEVGQVRRGTRVTERGRLGEWTKIAPPEGTALWISAQYVMVSKEPELVPEPVLQPLAEPESEEVDPVRDETPIVQEEALGAQDETPGEDGTSVAQQGEPLFDDEWVVTENPEGRPVDTRTLLRRDGTLNLPPPVEVERIPAGITKSRLDLNLVQGRKGSYRGTLTRSGMTSTTPSRFRLVLTEGRSRRHVCFVLGQEEQLTTLLDREMTIDGGVYWFKYSDSPVILAERIRLQP